jgi:hypothetical protein
MICTGLPHYSGDQIEKNEMGGSCGSCSACGEEEGCIQSFGGIT